MLAEDARERLVMAYELAGQRLRHVAKMPRKVKLARRHSICSAPQVRRLEYARDWEMRTPRDGTVAMARVQEMQRVTIQLVEVLELELKSITGADDDEEGKDGEDREAGGDGEEEDDEEEEGGGMRKKVKEGEREGINAYCIIRFAKDVEVEDGPLEKDLHDTSRTTWRAEENRAVMDKVAPTRVQ